MKKLLFFISLFSFWIILSERFTIESIIVGLFLSGLILISNTYLDLKSEYKRNYLSLLIKWTKFSVVLIKEVILANIQVAMIVLSPNMNISPQIIYYDTNLKSDFLQTMLSNCITLTPGTMTVDLVDNRLQIHCLNKEYADGVKNTSLERILIEIEEVYYGKVL